DEAKISKGNTPLSPLKKKPFVPSHWWTLNSISDKPCSNRISWLFTKNSLPNGCLVYDIFKLWCAINSSMVVVKETSIPSTLVQICLKIYFTRGVILCV